MTTNRYFQFLSNIVGRNGYDLLLRHLHRIEFYSLVPNDDNRGEDGKKLRDIFFEEVGYMASSSLPEGPCTVLEMLIGLSYRVENELAGNPRGILAREAFWIFIDNLDLAWCDDVGYLNRLAAEIIDDVIGVLLDRKYMRNGTGGIFPLLKTRKDQRKVEIWYQMSEYLLENYDF